MALAWVRLDSQFPSNPKVLVLVEDKQWRAIVAYIGGLSYAGAHGTDGFLPKSCLPFLHATSREATRLVNVGLWVPAGAGGWDIKDWAEYQPSTEETAKRAQRARDAAHIRWHGDKGGAA